MLTNPEKFLTIHYLIYKISCVSNLVKLNDLSWTIFKWALGPDLAGALIYFAASLIEHMYSQFLRRCTARGSGTVMCHRSSSKVKALKRPAVVAWLVKALVSKTHSTPSTSNSQI